MSSGEGDEFGGAVGHGNLEEGERLRKRVESEFPILTKRAVLCLEQIDPMPAHRGTRT